MAATKTSRNSKKATAVNRIKDVEVEDDVEALEPIVIGEVVTVVIKVIGTSPLLQNNPVEFIGKEGTGGLATKKKSYNDMEEARLRLYVNDDGQFCHPADSFKKSMLNAVTSRRFGKLHATTCVKKAVFAIEDLAVIEVKGKPAKKAHWIIDKRSVVIPANKSRVLRCRPCWPEWEMKIAFELEPDLLAPEHLLQAMLLAGRMSGIGDFRPSNGGKFGRFTAILLG